MKFGPTVLVLFVAAIFLSSIFVVFGSGFFKGEKAIIIVDMGTPDRFYKGQMTLYGNDTALKVLSNFATKIEIENGHVRCILDFCNNNNSEWKAYKMEMTDLGEIEQEITTGLEQVKIENGDTLIFRYA